MKFMKFGVAMGNPPFNVDASENGRKQPRYHMFMDSMRKKADMLLLVTPSRFLARAGHTPDEWNQKMLNDEHFKVFDYWPNGQDVFKDTDIKGGVVVHVISKNKTYEPIGIYVPFPELKSVLHKVEAKCDRFLDSIVSNRGMYRFSDSFFDSLQADRNPGQGGTGNMIISKSFERFPDVFLDSVDDKNGYVYLHGVLSNKRVGRYIRRENLAGNPYIDAWNVLIPEANGTGAIGEIMSTPLVGEPLVGHTDTFISIGVFGSEFEANACMKYVKSKFARAMLGIYKVTQHNGPFTWRRVPLQNFTENSDIDWTKPIADIDQQLYAKYGLDDVEIQFIEEKVRVME